MWSKALFSADGRYGFTKAGPSSGEDLRAFSVAQPLVKVCEPYSKIVLESFEEK